MATRETATELYLRDSIETQGGSPLRKPDRLANTGTRELHMEMGRAGFYPSAWAYPDEARDYFDSGERVWVEVLGNFDLPVPEHPKITLTIRDQRLQPLWNKQFIAGQGSECRA